SVACVLEPIAASARLQRAPQLLGDLGRDAPRGREVLRIRAADALVPAAAVALHDRADVRGGVVGRAGRVPGVLARRYVEARARRDHAHGVEDVRVVVEGREAL